jgi:hypothetical protein
MSQVRWRVLAAVTAGLMCASAALSGAAGAASAAATRPASSGINGVKGDPQPELKPFKIAGVGYGGGNAAVESNGAIVVAYPVATANGDGKTVVCVLARGASKCASNAVLIPPGGATLEDTPAVFALSRNRVVVLTGTCCVANPNDGDLVYTSTNGGKTFGAPVGVGGSVGVSAAALVGGQIVFDSGGHDGALVESVPVDPSGPPAETANPITAVSYDIGVGSYKGGALIASQYDGSNDSTSVIYAPAGKNFNANGSYHKVGGFANEELVGISGDALLTEEGTGTGALKLRLFNGTTFGPAHVVPHSGGSGPAWFYFAQDLAGRSHVFSDRSDAPVSYDLYMLTTSTGAAWTSALDLGHAVDSNTFGSALDSIGSGLVIGSADHYPVWAYPVLATQGVSFGLQKSSIAKGHATIGAGKGGPIGKGRDIWLQVERHGTWYSVAVTHEASNGSYSFTIKGSAAGTYVYRAVVSDFAGYLQYGYSAGRALKVS